MVHEGRAYSWLSWEDELYANGCESISAHVYRPVEMICARRECLPSIGTALDVSRILLAASYRLGLVASTLIHGHKSLVCIDLTVSKVTQ